MVSFFSKNDKELDQFLERWRPLMEQAMTSMPAELPQLPKSYVRFVINEWNRLYEVSGPEARVGLAVFACRLNIHRYAVGMLIDRKPEVRLAGVKILGYVGDESNWAVLASLARQKHQEVAFAALAALVRINGRRAVEELLNEIVSRIDWSTADIIDLLKETDTRVPSLERQLKQYLENQDVNQRYRVLRIMKLFGCEEPSSHT